jgi:DNA-binding transcriptional ArsR family regulator
MRPTIEAPNSHANPGARSTARSGTRETGVATAAADTPSSLRPALALAKRFGQERIHSYDVAVISYVFGPADLGRVRFAVSPLFELAASWQVLRDPARHSIHGPWVKVARERVAGLDLAMLDAVIPEGPYLPDFVTPPPEHPRTDLAAELRRVRATDPEQVARELAWAYPGRRLPPAARVLVDDPKAGLRRLIAVMEAYWERALAPWWERLRATLESDIAYRGARLAEGGPVAAFSDLNPGVSWRDGTLDVRRPYEATVALEGRGLVLLPVVFAWGHVWAMIDPPWQPTLVYAPRGVGLLWERPQRAPDALADLLGRRRALLLAELATPATTQELARRLRASAGGVSEHLGVLRRAGLIAGRRDGRAVRYERTRTGDDLAGL